MLRHRFELMFQEEGLPAPTDLIETTALLFMTKMLEQSDLIGVPEPMNVESILADQTDADSECADYQASGLPKLRKLADSECQDHHSCTLLDLGGVAWPGTG